MNGFFAGLVGAFVEAWAELRIHKTRVLLSLIGVAVAVAAITGVVGVAAIAEQAQREQYEAQGGRPALLLVSAYSESGDPIDTAEFATAFDTAAERYKIGHTARNGYGTKRVQFVDGVLDVNIILTDVNYAVMHRTTVGEGAWFTDADEQRLAPNLIVNHFIWEKMGSPDLRTHPTLDLLGDGTVTAVVTAVMPKQQYEDYPEMRMLYSAWERIATPAELEANPPSYEAWVPPALARDLTDLIKRDVAGALGTGVMVDVSRQDYAGWADQAGGEDPLLPFKIVVGGVSALVLFLGALSLVNISLVTVRQRIREIGIRRSFGATAGRVFFAVMMESIVGTIVAGLAGVIFAVLVVSNEWVRAQVAPQLQDVPGFPVEAAVLGMICATAVGALAGLLPALVAVRVKVIDAIRY
ncbi:ABC transporter permease [Glaciihabitans arcticus]|uniref:ABC transporter permease n=1 Tax=Glaciihabitans arcticus TaxID=2668039 RepID=A0A4Q9GNZ7_9MICO|nr:ABC transporter permease [Glaciihabitans arcticus]TBN56461.1 ABC transporter permease [Glaciihabitans arcticus]